MGRRFWELDQYKIDVIKAEGLPYLKLKELNEKRAELEKVPAPVKTQNFKCGDGSLDQQAGG